MRSRDVTCLFRRDRSPRRAILAALAACVLTAACGPESEEPSSTSNETSGGGGGSGGSDVGGDASGPANFDANTACTTVPQSGCSPDDTCAIATLDGITACQNGGTSPAGAYCGSDYDCGPGLTCIGSTCRAQCHVPADCEGTAPSCFQIYFGDVPASGYLVCSSACNPADPQNAAQDPSLVACPGGFGCYGRDAPQGATDCFAAGTSGLGGVCETGGECAPGLVCLNNGSSASCQPYCVKGQSSCNCLSFAQPSYAAIGESLVEVGYCG